MRLLRWWSIVHDGSPYHPNGTCSELSFDGIRPSDRHDSTRPFPLAPGGASAAQLPAAGGFDGSKRGEDAQTNRRRPRRPLVVSTATTTVGTGAGLLHAPCEARREAGEGPPLHNRQLRGSAAAPGSRSIPRFGTCSFLNSAAVGSGPASARRRHRRPRGADCWRHYDSTRFSDRGTTSAACESANATLQTSTRPLAWTPTRGRRCNGIAPVAPGPGASRRA